MSAAPVGFPFMAVSLDWSAGAFGMAVPVAVSPGRRRWRMPMTMVSCTIMWLRLV